MPRFVVLEHDHPQVHWDLMIEQQAGLLTFRLAQPPESTASIAATPLPVHRLLYLDYEGPVTGGRGTVTRWDQGDCDFSTTADGGFTATFRGVRLQGPARMIPGVAEGDWLFCWDRS